MNGIQHWRNLPPTEKQLELISELQWMCEFKGKTRGEASDFISKYLSLKNELNGVITESKLSHNW